MLRSLFSWLSDTSLIRITENKISIVDEEAVKRLHKVRLLLLSHVLFFSTRTDTPCSPCGVQVRPDQFADMLALVGAHHTCARLSSDSACFVS